MNLALQVNIVHNAPIAYNAISLGGSALQYSAQGEPAQSQQTLPGPLMFVLVLLSGVVIIGLFIYVKVNLNTSNTTTVYTAPTVIVPSALPTPPAPASTASTALPKAEALPRPQPKQGVSESSRPHSDQSDCGSSGLKTNDNANTDTDKLGTKNRAAP